MLTPLQVEPLPVVRVWGGQKLAAWRGYRCDQPVGESWEVHGSQPVKGWDCSLDQLCERFHERLLGRWGRHLPPGFPLLTKWLDCQEWLSVQVHPDDTVARRLQGKDCRGKAEAWYFAEVQDTAEVIHGWRGPRPTRQQLEQIEGSEWLDWVRRFRPRPGEWSYTPPGTVHALGPGLLVFEVQQSSDLTYRLYDWDRSGLDGLPRPLHRAESLDSICDSPPESVVAPPSDVLGHIEVLCPHFVVERVEGPRGWSPRGNSVELLTSLNSAARVRCQDQTWELKPGDSLVVPAEVPSLNWESPGPWLRVRLAPN